MLNSNQRTLVETYEAKRDVAEMAAREMVLAEIDALEDEDTDSFGFMNLQIN
jgi:hypothetical protein